MSMPRLPTRRARVASLLAVCACAAVAAQSQPVPPATMPAEKVEKMESADTVAAPRYRCGGIGSDESTAIRAEMKAHPLSLLFARADGNYLADVDVRIQGAAAPPLNFNAKGPVCLVDLPPGKYSVQAVTEGRTKTQEVTLGSGARTLDFRF